MKLSTDRILTTHVGSLPRPHPLVALLIKKDRNEPYDAAEFAAQVRQAVADIVARQVEDRHRRRERRRDQQGRLCDLCARTPHRLRRRAVRAEAESRRRALCGFPPAAGAVHRTAADPPPVLHRSDRAPGPRIGAARTSTTSRRRSPRRSRSMRSCRRRRRVWCPPSSPTGIIPTMPPTSMRSPMRCRRNTRRSPRPGSWCNSTAPISRWRGIPASRT